jgi:hypothetical protein
VVAAATLAGITPASMTTAAHAQATDEPTRHDVRRPPTQGQVAEAWHRRSATSQQDKATDAPLGRVLAREPFSIPDPTPAQLPVSAPTQPNRQPSWLLVSLGVLAVEMLVAGLAVVGPDGQAAGPDSGNQPDHDRCRGRPTPAARRPPTPGSRRRRSRPETPFHLMLQAHTRKEGTLPCPCSPSIASPTWPNDPTAAWNGPARSVAATSSAIRTGSWSWRPECPARPS